MKTMKTLLLCVGVALLGTPCVCEDVSFLEKVTGFSAQQGPNTLFPYFNFVDGFKKAGWTGWFQWFTGNKFNEPKKGEKLGIVSYQEYAKTVFKKEFPNSLFERYYTGNNIPSWENNGDHKIGVGLLSTFMKAARAVGAEPIDAVHSLSSRAPFDHEKLTEVTWDGFYYLKPDEIKYASNGAYGKSVVDNLQENRYKTIDTLGVLVTESVFGAHLVYDETSDLYSIDLQWMSKYTPLEGIARLGGKATFKLDGNLLRTVSIEHTNGTVYTPAEDDAYVNDAFARSQLLGWRYAEKVLIASLLSMTNLIMHVKDLHLEIAAVVQAVTVDYFADDTSHPVRRMMDPFIHRSVQATNDNMRLLFDYEAAEWSLAPLDTEEQLRLIEESMTQNPLSLATLDMENYGRVRNMPESASQKGGFWRWHYRALTVQRAYERMVRCWLDANYASDEAVEADATLQKWWQAMIQYMPAVQRALATDPTWASDVLTKEGLVRVARTLMVWLSWIHEDVGHSAAAYVYNPIHTPMSVPEDGNGIPLLPYTFNVAAYRGFVFLQRAALLDSPPSHWFSGSEDRQCFATFQDELITLGETDTAFSECDAKGFYSCVDRVETAVSS